jgi:hypothetical protein
MTPSILARVKYRARTADLLAIDWDADDANVERAPATARQRRASVDDKYLRSLDPERAEEVLRGHVRHAHQGLSGPEQERIVLSLLRRRARLAARSARAAGTPRVQAVLFGRATKESA